MGVGATLNHGPGIVAARGVRLKTAAQWGSNHMTGIIDPARFGMPDATTTGVQSGVTLTNYTAR